MPCTEDSACSAFSVPADITGSPNFDPVGDGINNHYANMGWVGFVLFDLLGTGSDSILLRVTSLNVNAKQEVTKPDVIDGRIDPTVYQLGPMIVEGSLSMPVVIDTAAGGCPEVNDLTTAGTVLNNTWCWATSRTNQGRMSFDRARLQVRYANHVGYDFDTCVVNTYGISVTQGDMVTLDIDVIGRGRVASGKTDPFDPQELPGALENPALKDFDDGDMLAPARTLLWSDVSVTGIGGCARAGDILFRSNQVREFSFDINNNADRFYTLCGSLFPVDVNVGKREITGSLKLLGMQEQLRMLAQTNQERFTEKNEIRMAYYIGEDQFDPTLGHGGFVARDWIGDGDVATSIFSRKFVGVIFQIEEIEMTNEVLETTIAWHAMGDDQHCYQAIDPTASDTFPVWQ